VTGQRTESDQKCRKSIAEEVGTKFVQSVYWLETFKSLWNLGKTFGKRLL